MVIYLDDVAYAMLEPRNNSITMLHMSERSKIEKLRDFTNLEDTTHSDMML